MFPLIVTVTMIVMALFGGKGTVWGPVVGAVALFVIQEIVWARYPYVHPLLFGAIIVAVVLLMPRGVLGLLQLQVPAAADHLDGDPRRRGDAQELRRRHRRQRRVVRAGGRAHLRADRAQRLRQDDAVQLHHRAGAARRRPRHLQGRADRSPQALPGRQPRHRPHLPGHPGLSRADRAGEPARRHPRLPARGRAARARAAGVREARAAGRGVCRQPVLRPAEARGVRARAHDATPP